MGKKSFFRSDKKKPPKPAPQGASTQIPPPAPPKPAQPSPSVPPPKTATAPTPVLAAPAAAKLAPTDFSHGRLKVSDNQRFLVHADGTPFFYLGDTAWELLHHLTREEADVYLANRAAKGFTVIQVVIIPEINGLDVPNRYGDLPLIDLNPCRPNEKYFTHLDYVVEKAATLGLCLALLPTWGSYTVEEKHVLFEDHYIFNPGNSYDYGYFLGQRYGQRKNIIWVLGGDRMPVGRKETWRALAKGILGAAAERPLLTYHPYGGCSSGEWLHDESWLSFNMLQSGHDRLSQPYALVEREYARTPPKPILNAEPGYEAIPNKLADANDKLTERDVRRFAYWSLFAGAFGHTYGANELWMMWAPQFEPLCSKINLTPLLAASTPWNQAVDYPGAFQMRHVRALMESRPMLARIPDQSLLATPAGEGLSHLRATRSSDGSYAMIYFPQPGQKALIEISKHSGGKINAWWFDPRTGGANRLDGNFTNTGRQEFTSPANGPDWVLVLDDAAKNFPPPGKF